MEIIKGGFALDEAQQRLVTQQRSITAQVNNNLIQVGAVFLQMADKNPVKPDWFQRKFRDTNLQEWIDDPDMRVLNVGFNLQFGWLDVDIDAEDPRYNECIIKAMKFLGVDTRFAFGRASKGIPTHLLVQLTESDQANYEELKEFAPKPFSIDGKRFWCDLRSVAPLPDNAQANTKEQSRQTVVPGSIYKHKTKPNTPDISVWYGMDGKIATHVSDIAVTTSRRVDFSKLITGVAFGTLLYVIQPHWIEGGRQVLANKVSGFLARVVRESQGINDSEGLARGVFCPISTPETAEALIEFICAEMGDNEPFMRKRTFRDALRKLDNNPEAKIPGWKKMQETVGAESSQALYSVFMPGVDVSALTKIAEQYFYDKSDDKYIDRNLFQSTLRFTFDSATLHRRHSNEFMDVGGKSKPIMKLLEASPLRRSVDYSDCDPNLTPGSVVRRSKSGTVMSDDEDSEPGTVTMFNTWRGFAILPTKNLDLELLKQCDGMLTQLLTYLCQGNVPQMNWVKKYLAWTVQNPGKKQQVAPVFIGGQGVGKSFFGNIFLGSIFQSQWGSASPKVLEGAFSVEPFINKVFVFIDEAKFRHEESVDEMKKIIRSVQVPGSEKFQSSRTYNIYARPVFASNRFDINMGGADDRALFFIKAYDKDFLNITAQEFKKWTLTLKPFFDQFAKFLDRLDVKEHSMYLFNTIEVSRHEIEDVSISSGNDSHIIESNMDYPRRVAKFIIEDGRIWEDQDITAPFTMNELGPRVTDTCKLLGLRNIQAQRVLAEFKAAGLIEPHRYKNLNYYRFKYKLGTLIEMASDAFGVKLESGFTFTEDDYGANETTCDNAKPWRRRLTRFNI